MHHLVDGEHATPTHLPGGGPEKGERLARGQALAAVSVPHAGGGDDWTAGVGESEEDGALRRLTLVPTTAAPMAKVRPGSGKTRKETLTLPLRLLMTVCARGRREIRTRAGRR